MSNMKYFGKIFWSIYSSPKFSTQMLQLFIIKICFTNKFNTTCGGGQLLVSGCQESMCHRISVLSVLVSWFWVSGSQVPSPRVSVLRSRVSKSHVPGSDNLGPGSQVLIVDYAFVNDLTKKYFNICDTMATQSKNLFSSNSKIQSVSVLEGEQRVSYSSWWKIFFFVLSMCIPKRLIRLYSNLVGLFDDQRKYPFVFISVLDLAL